MKSNAMASSRYLLFLLVIFLTTTSFAQDFKPLDNWLEHETPQMGGRAVLVIWKDGKVVHQTAVNGPNGRQKMMSNMMMKRQSASAGPVDFTTETAIPIASCSKWLSAALVMTFIDEGKLRLTDTVGKFLPTLSESGKGSITIAQCLSHTTGIDAPPLRENLQGMRDNNSMDDAIKDIAAMPLEGAPGTVFHYSNVGLQIAGAVIEKIGRRDFETLFQERIAKPLNMSKTNFGHKQVALPAGGAISSANDYGHFLMMIQNRGVYNGRRILSEKSVVAMQVNRLTGSVRVSYKPGEAGKISGYGFGEWINDGGSLVTSPGLFGSVPWMSRTGNYCAMLLTYYVNNKGRGERYEEMFSLVERAMK